MTDMRCVECGKVVTHAGPPTAGGHWDSSAPTKLDERYGTGYCSFTGKVVRTVAAGSVSEATAHRVAPKTRAAKPEPVAFFPTNTDFGKGR